MTDRNHTLTDEKIERYGRTFYRIRHADGREGGWAETLDSIPPDSSAQFYGDALCFKGGKFYSGKFRGGVFHDGKFRGGVFHDGVFHDGVFYGGVFHDGVFYGGVFHDGDFYDGEFWGGKFYDGDFYDGVFHDGVFYGNEFCGGEFYDGVFCGGEFYDGVFLGGVFRGGEFYQSPCSAQRSDGYVFVAKYVDDDLRIWAGCRNFSWGEAVAHWNDDHEHGAESQRIIHFLKAQAEAERERDAKREKTND